MKYKLALVMSVLCAFSAWTEAKVKLPAILSDGMVLQRERPVKIWGNADKGENVTVVFKKKKFSTVAGEDGKWLVELPPMKAGGPFEMTVNDIRLKDILVGDVWLCSGQSNMELTAGRVTDKFAEEIARDENPMIRYVKIPLGNDLHGPKDDLPGADWLKKLLLLSLLWLISLPRRCIGRRKYLWALLTPVGGEVPSRLG